MPLDKLLSSIEEEARKEAEAILIRAKEEAAEQIAEAQKKAAEQARHFVEQKVFECNRRAEQQISQKKLEARHQLLKVRQQLIRAVFSEALQHLQSMNDADYQNWVKKRIVSVYNGEKIEIIFSRKDEKRLPPMWQQEVKQTLEKQWTSPEIVFHFQKTDFEGGFILKTPQFEIVYSFEQVLQTLENELQGKINRILFEQKD